MLADPQNITLSQGAKVAPRYLTGTARGRFASGDGTAVVEAEQIMSSNRKRTVVRVEDLKTLTDPLTSIPIKALNAVTLTINRPVAGFTEDEIILAVTGLIGWLTAGTNANLKKVVAGEN